MTMPSLGTYQAETEARAPGGLGDANAVVVEANSAVRLRLPKMRAVLDEETPARDRHRIGGRKNRAAWRESKRAGKSVGLASLGGGDVVGELFVNEAVDGIGSGLDFVVIEIGGDGGADDSLRGNRGPETAEWAVED